MIALTLNAPPPAEIDAGAKFSLFLTIAARPARDLGNAPFVIKESERTVLTGRLGDLTGDQHDTAEVVVRAPERVGAFTWTCTLAAPEINGNGSEEASVDFSFVTRAHTTSLAVWGAPPPVHPGQLVTVNAGAKCAAGCNLAGQEIAVHDETGQVVGRGSLGTSPWPGTTALFWSPITLTAPAEKRHVSWSLGFSAREPHPLHGSASASLQFMTVAPPDHSVSVRVVEKETQSPIPDVQVRVGLQRTSTNESGVARIDVPAGEHAVTTWKAGYDAPDTVVRVMEPQELLIEMTTLPEDDHFAFWRG